MPPPSVAAMIPIARLRDIIAADAALFHITLLFSYFDADCPPIFRQHAVDAFFDAADISR